MLDVLDSAAFADGLVVGAVAGVMGVFIFTKKLRLLSELDKQRQSILVLGGLIASIVGFAVGSVGVVMFGVVFAFVAMLAHYKTMFAKKSGDKKWWGYK